MSTATSISPSLDPAMPALALALDPEVAQPLLVRAVQQWRPGFSRVRLRQVRLLRHKAGRRALIEYDFSLVHPSGSSTLRLLGKIRAKGLDRRTPRLTTGLQRAGFDADSSDGISVPEMVGIVPELDLWLQRKVAGVPLTHWIAGADGSAMARRVAEAAHKLHTANIPTNRQHTVENELEILEHRLRRLANDRPDLASRLDRVLAGCRKLAACLHGRPTRGIHRDFYPAQVLATRGRIWLLDFDLYTSGDPALDIGNFLGHITEQSLRETGDARAMASVESGLLERYVELAGDGARDAACAYQTLTLARHIFISTQFPERQRTTLPLLELCESTLL